MSRIFLLIIFLFSLNKIAIAKDNEFSPDDLFHIDQIAPFSMGKKIYDIANAPKYSYFTKYDDHMMEYDEKLVLALKSFFKSLN